MGFLRLIFLSVFLLVTMALAADPAPQPAPAPGSTAAATPALPKSDQDLLKTKFEKMQQVLAQEASPEQAKEKERAYKPTNSRDVMMLSFKIMFYIAVLSVLLYFGIKAFKKGAMGRGMMSHHKSIEVLESAHLGPNKTVNLVQVLDRVLVLGVTDRAVNLLSVIEDEASVKRIRANNRETASAVAGSFSASVNGFLSKFKKDGQGKSLNVYQQENGEGE